MEKQLLKTTVKEVKRRMFEESVPRIKKCLAQLSEEEIWWRPNAETVSVGNLVLHLNGNVRQWILSGLGKQPDHRQRQAEFDEKGPVPTEKLLSCLDELEKEVNIVLDQITSDDLVNIHAVQGFQESGMAILLHVTEHFSYHTGQITWMVKASKAVDMKYYGGMDLEAKN
jgi:uncharacterized damage-inducible protein DinB